MIPTEFFRTRRLLFRPFIEGDLDALAAIAGDPQVARSVGDRRPLPREAVALWIARSRENIRIHGYGTGALVELDGRQLVGWAGWARPSGEPEEIVYGFARRAWGQGYATEVAAGLVRYAAEVLQLRELRAHTYVHNTASRRVLERLGFDARPPQDDEILHILSLGRPTPTPGRS